MDAHRSIKKLLKGHTKAPSYHKRLSHVRNKSSYGGSGAAAGGLLGGAGGLGEGGDAAGAIGGLCGEDFTRETVSFVVACILYIIGLHHHHYDDDGHDDDGKMMLILCPYPPLLYATVDAYRQQGSH